jgi:divalent metal cation (Fe/Co/Zn/Cd) transporter
MRSQVEQTIDQTLILGLRVIFGSFLMGVLIFLGLSVVMHLTQEPPAEIPLESVSSPITIFTLAYMLFAIPISGIVFKKLLKVEKKSNPTTILANIRTAMLARVAIFELAALFAATAIFIAVLDGYILGNSMIWLNLVPLAYFTLHIAMNFPSKQGILTIYDENYT